MIDCDKWSMVAVDEDLISYIQSAKLSELHRESIFYIQRWYCLLSRDESVRCEPKFKTLSQLQSGAKS